MKQYIVKMKILEVKLWEKYEESMEWQHEGEGLDKAVIAER